jgi:hypothetical protein
MFDEGHFLDGKTVHVRTYLRCRYGKWEEVQEHWRHPRSH